MWYLFTWKYLWVDLTDTLEDYHWSIKSIFCQFYCCWGFHHPVKYLFKCQFFWLARYLSDDLFSDGIEGNSFFLMFVRWSMQMGLDNNFMFLYKLRVRVIKLDMFGLAISGGRLMWESILEYRLIISQFFRVNRWWWEYDSIIIILLKMYFKIVLELIQFYHILWSSLHLYLLYATNYTLKYNLNHVKTTIRQSPLMKWSLLVTIPPKYITAQINMLNSQLNHLLISLFMIISILAWNQIHSLQFRKLGKDLRELQIIKQRYYHRFYQKLLHLAPYLHLPSHNYHQSG